MTRAASVPTPSLRNWSPVDIRILQEAQKSNCLPFNKYIQMYILSSKLLSSMVRYWQEMATYKDAYSFALYQIATETSKEFQGRPVRLCKAYTSPWTLQGRCLFTRITYSVTFYQWIFEENVQVTFALRHWIYVLTYNNFITIIKREN